VPPASVLRVVVQAGENGRIKGKAAVAQPLQIEFPRHGGSLGGGGGVA
jgi:hypothetical protein